MKKTLLAITLLLGLMYAGSSFAITANFGGIKLNIETPKQTTTQNTATSQNAQKIKSQIDTLNTKLNSASSTYQTTITKLANAILSQDELNNYNNELAKLNQTSLNNLELNINIAEDGTVAINNALQQDANSLKNLSSSKITDIQNAFSTLKNLNSAYKDICSQGNALLVSIKNDPRAALSLKSDLLTLTKNINESSKQAQNIAELTSNITTALSKAGITIK